MKTKIAAAMIALCVALVPAMPAWAKNSGEKTKGLLPESVEVTQAAVDEGTVDEGEVPVDLYSQRMLWGTWVLEDEEASFSKYVDVKIDGTDYQLEAFPSEFLLGTDTVKLALYSGRLHEIFDEGTYANVGYDFGPDCKVNKPFSISTDGSIHDGDLKLRTVFAVKNRTLAIGLGNLPEKPKKGTKIDITEIDYEMEWKGPRLVLSYGGTSAAYVPYCYKEDDDGKVFVGHSEQLVSSMKDGFVHISVGQEDPDYIETKYDPRVRADFEFKDDGTYSIKDYIGNEYTGSYYYSGDVITLAEEKGVTVIDIVSSPFRFEWTNTPSLSFIVGKDKAPACLGNKVEGIIFREGLLKTDNYKPGDKIKAYIKEVKRSDYNCQVILSRTDNNFLAMLIAEQVIEIQDGMIDVKAISRRPGEKAKVAVFSNDGRLDAVGACIGARGSRIKPIVDELRGEKVDIVNWDRDVVNFAKNAITPAKATFGEYDDDNETISLVVPDDQLKLAIGKAGINVRLASQVVGCNITVVSESDKKAKAQEKFAKDVDLMVKALDVEEPVAQFFVSSSIYTPADLVSVGAEKLVKSGVFNDDIANELINRASEYLAKQKAQNEAQLDKLGVDKSVLEISGMTPEIAILLGEKGVKNTQDVADLSSDEFVDICGEQYANVATKIVMSARQMAYGIE